MSTSNSKCLRMKGRYEDIAQDATQKIRWKLWNINLKILRWPDNFIIRISKGNNRGREKDNI